MHINLKSVLILSALVCFAAVSAYGSNLGSEDTKSVLQEKEFVSSEAEALYQKGLSAYKEKNFAEAVPLLQKAADMDHGRAQFYLGYCYYVGYEVQRDFEAAAKWFAKSAEKGYEAAQYNLGNLYYNGQGVIQDQEKAVELFRKAAEQGYADAQNNLGYCYQHGTGTPVDLQQARIWYSKAIAQGHKLAKNNLNSINIR